MTRAINISDHFTYKKLLKFVMPSIFMMIFTSIYGVVDGIFISNFAGQTAFAGANIIMPFIMALGAIGFMLGTGGSAIVAKTLGEGEPEKAQKYFTFLVIATVVAGVLVASLGEIFLRPICILLGSSEEMLPYSIDYARIVLIGIPFFMLQNIFQTFFATAGKPKLGFMITVAAGVTNMVLDALFVGLFKWGVQGAAAATTLSECVGGVVPIFFFARKNSTALRFVKTRFYGKVLLKACTNGCSELIGNISGSVVSMLYNAQLMKYVGESGVSAYGVLMYVNFIFIAVFIGYSVGTAPIVGFNFGARNKHELKNVFKKSMMFMLVAGIAMCVAAELLAPVLASIFASNDINVYNLTCRAFFFYGFVFLFAGFNIFTSAFFTALSNGVISLVVSLLRTLAFQATCILTLPVLFGNIGWSSIDGIWIAALISDVLALLVNVVFIMCNRKKYGYL